MKKKNNLPVYIVAFALLLGGLVFLVVSGAQQNAVYFLNVSEALAMAPEKLTSARLFGNVAEADIERLDSPPGVVFNLLDEKDNGKSMRVKYNGVVPDTFKAGAEVIVEGGIEQGKNVFTASTLMTKCPSKYEKENRENNT